MRRSMMAGAAFGGLLLAAALQGCSRSGQPPHAGGSAARPGASAELALRVELPRDTIPRGDRGAVEVFYSLVNGPAPLRFDNNPGSWQIRLQAEDGTEVAPTVLASPAAGGEHQVGVQRPRGVLSQAGNLRCIRDGGGYMGDPTAPDECLGSWALDRAGVYRVIVEYAGPDLRPSASTPGGTAADSATGRPPPPPVLRLADTATLVVTDR